ncbi:MAG: RtcB family protein [Hungatella sp.]|nr:RtcB family protein [Hungatella sp.]
MFVIYNEKTRKPIKVWLENIDQIEKGCLEQAYHLADLPFIHKWVCLMPDTHTGKGMPIGGVIATQGVIMRVKDIVTEKIQKYSDQKVVFGEEINCHHNYASLENHYGKNVWVHRKGATRARSGELAVIPGAMGSYSYVVKGRGNEESFCTSSHGAGRAYSRKGAMEAFSCEDVLNDLKEQGIVLGKTKKADVAEESRFAYKDIEAVMGNQNDLVEIVSKLKTIAVVKG